MGHGIEALLGTLFDSGLDLRERRIFLGDLNKPNDALRALLFLDRTEGPIELWVNSPGGAIENMFALYDAITTRRNKVTTVGTGSVESAAALILACGDRRLATENCWLMTHAMRVSGGKDDLFERLDTVKAERRWWKRWAELMARHTKHRAGWWYDLHRKQARELWLDAGEMVAHGLVDEVVPRTE